MADIIHDELVQALIDAMQPCDDDNSYPTAKELADRLGWNIDKIYRALRVLQDQGQLEVIRVRRKRLDQQRQSVPGYKLIC